MPDFIPFRAVRPPRDRAHLVGSRSYITYTDESLHDKLLGNPFTFLHVIMPDTKHSTFKDLNMEQRFEIVRSEYIHFQKKGHLIQDEKPAFYLYRQTKDDHEYVGIIGGVSSADYDADIIKKHEDTITKREAIFKKYLETTSFNAEPVLLAYEDSDKINAVTRKILKKRPEFEFYTTDEVKHELWLIKKDKHQKEIKSEVLALPALYIADGHHRSASSALLSRACEGQMNSNKSHFMAMLIPKSSLKIYEFNRVVKDLNGLSKQAFLKALETDFTVTVMDQSYQPQRMHLMGMYLDKQWYKLEVKKQSILTGVINNLDTKILTQKILQPILGIEDLKTDSRVDFVTGTEGLEAIIDRVNSDKYKVGFCLFPVSFDQLKDVSDAHLTMPPKSTWIEPKLRSGLTIYNLIDE